MATGERASMSAIKVVVALPLWHRELPPHSNRSNVSGHEGTEHREARHLGILTPRQAVFPQGHVGIWDKPVVGGPRPTVPK